MAKRPKENDYVPCHCQQCNGKHIDQANWLMHNGQVQSGIADIPDTLFYMGAWWKRESLAKG